MAQQRSSTSALSVASNSGNAFDPFDSQTHCQLWAEDYVSGRIGQIRMYFN